MNKNVLIFLFLLASFSGLTQIKPYDLKLEYRENPEGVDVKKPRFFWKLKSAEAGQYQKNYQLIVATSKENIEKGVGDVYNSKKVKSSQTTQILYKGKPLRPATQYYWKVKVWDKNNIPSWSKIATFSTGLFQKEDWKNAQWIAWKPQKQWEKEWWERKDIESKALQFQLPSLFGSSMSMFERYHFHHQNPYDASPLLRKAFKVSKKVKHAKAYISGLGYYELFINGKRIGTQVLDPGWTDYRQTILYATHDITEQIQNGENLAGVMLGRGFYGQLAYDHWGFYKKDGYVGQPKLLCLIKVQYEDGTEENVISDLSWKVTGGPIVYDGPHMAKFMMPEKKLKIGILQVLMIPLGIL
ncbi:alpha-L-rhamnosidase N-terminal domain-containing protein [Jejuia pallidilutea]|uniref:Alpha-rhamnosidase n=1 Tax=Jejuia pallidilutea TaxID=504487 RepID=A0A090W1P0_9FLAO|nr:alpha-L-rhamnosidase N-terminal domain-containing protein [Jejuia pallidilutea]GAL70851.1 alpha-rhamnosidase [Jejuia pallidilutea]